jgi:hypothetical protein
VKPARALAWLCAIAFALSTTLAAAANTESKRDPAEPDWRSIKQVIGAQLEALRKGDGKRAYAHASEGIKVQFHDADNFLRMVRDSYGALLTARYTEFLDGAVIEGAIVQPLRLVMPDGTVLVALYQMEKEADGRWHIAGCVIAPSTARAT